MYFDIEFLQTLAYIFIDVALSGFVFGSILSFCLAILSVVFLPFGLFKFNRKK